MKTPTDIPASIPSKIPGNINALRQSIQEKALQLGFHLIGFSPLGPFAETHFFETWLHAGFHAGMDYLENRKNERLEIQRYFPEVKSVISLGTFYHPRENPKKKETNAIQIARYAQGKDYHSVIPKKLKQLLRHIHALTPCKTKLCVDTAPVLERMYGYHAGLGWIGKNTCLINPKFGSYFFLSEILIDIDLAHEKLETNHCGTCTKCLDACPTGALPKAYTLDATKCISYLTIEHRGDIPLNLQREIDNNLFGCDICQEVCPWNHETQFSKPFSLAIDPKFFPLEDSGATVNKIKKANEETFSSIFAGRPLKRAKLSGLKRNLSIIEKNINDSD